MTTLLISIGVFMPALVVSLGIFSVLNNSRNQIYPIPENKQRQIPEIDLSLENPIKKTHNKFSYQEV